MDKETYKALKDLTAYLELQRASSGLTEVLEKELKQVNNWIDKVAKEYTEDKQYPKCEGCGEYLLDGQMVVKGENRHSACS